MLSYIASDIRKNDNDRFLCTLLAPEDKREEIFTIYAFNLELSKVKETTKEEMIGLIRFQWWREAIEEIYAGKVRKHDVVERISEIAKKYAMPKNLFLDAIDEREKELAPICFQTKAELENYVDKATGNIFRLVAKILSVEEDVGGLAKAWVYAGILRSVKFNAMHNKVFFPQEMLEKHGVSAEDILTCKFNGNVKNLIKELHNEAHAALKNIKKHKKFLAVYAHKIIADAYLRRIKKAGFDVFNNDFEGKKFSIHLKLLLASI